MGSKMKMIAAIALVLGVVSIAFLAAPIQAYVNGTGNGDFLQTQDRDRVRTRNCDCNCDCTQTQYRSRQRTNECATNRICNCTMSLEHYRYQNRERTRSLGHRWVSIKTISLPLSFFKSQNEITKSARATFTLKCGPGLGLPAPFKTIYLNVAWLDLGKE